MDLFVKTVLYLENGEDKHTSVHCEQLQMIVWNQADGWLRGRIQGKDMPTQRKWLGTSLVKTRTHWEALFYFLKFTFIYLLIWSHPCSLQDLSSLTRDWTCALGSGRAESEPLDHWGSPGLDSNFLIEACVLIFG